MRITLGRAAAWFEWRAKNTPMAGARAMFEMAAAALREKAEREDPKPLTYNELLQMDGELVWFEAIDISDYSIQNESSWAEVCIPTWKQEVWFWRFGNECEMEPTPKNYGKTWIAYRHKPKEVQE